jgi:isoleucyl-tRNA synthetase
LVAEELVEVLQKELNSEISVLGTFESSAFESLRYRSVVHDNLAYRFLPSTRVTKDKGTGLMHTSFTHGVHDYEVCRFDDLLVND